MRLSLTDGQPVVVECVQTSGPSVATLQDTDSTFATFNCGVWTPQSVTPVESEAPIVSEVPAEPEVETGEEAASGSLDLGSVDLGSVGSASGDSGSAGSSES